MLKLLSYILQNGIATVREPCPPLNSDFNGMPMLSKEPCTGEACNACARACPTDAIEIIDLVHGQKRTQSAGDVHSSEEIQIAECTGDTPDIHSAQGAGDTHSIQDQGVQDKEASKSKASVQSTGGTADTTTVQGSKDSNGAKVTLDLGACIGCHLCIDLCPTGTITESLTTTIARKRREDLILRSDQPRATQAAKGRAKSPGITQQLSVLFPDNKLSIGAVEGNLFRQSLHARVVCTGCSACDLEIGACSSPVFDLERFGVHIVASPRFADALLVTGPVGKGMRDSLLRCYAAMPDPKIVVAVGTCAISGGVHKNGYAEANGVDKHLPVAVYIPGCPPHPWNIIHGILLAMGKIDS